MIGYSGFSQTSDFVKGKSYVIDTIKVKGLKSFNAQTVISYSGLRKGQEISVPGEEVSEIINKLWNLELFSDINFYVTRAEGKSIDLEIEIEELPTLTDVKVKGLKKGKIDILDLQLRYKGGFTSQPQFQATLTKDFKEILTEQYGKKCKTP